jgi:flagellar protein FliO/FliZ
MTQSWILVGAFLGVLVCLPLLLKWIKQRVPGRFADASGQSRFVSALAVGPHQRVVTVEVGPEGKRVWLTLGVTGQTISCLHCVDVDATESLGTTTQAGPDRGALVVREPELH